MGKPLAIRPSKNSRWRALVLLLVHALIAVHIAHWMSAGASLTPLEPSEAMEFSKHGIVNAGLIFFALTILSTLILGRWFCGWACHLVALQDGSLWLLRKVGVRPRPMRSRLLVFVPLVAAVYMFLYPLAYRVWHGAGFGVNEVALIKADFWETFPPWPVALATFFICGFAAVYLLGAKGFCTYACPYGAIFGLADKLAVGRIRVTDACAGCGHCTATCTSNVVVHQEVRDHGMVVDPGCMKCLDCVSVCPTNALYFGFGRPSLAVKGKPGRRSKAHYSIGEEGLLGLAFVVAFFVYRGLYGVTPFLMALAIAGVVAYLSVAAARLAYRPSVTLGARALKREGRMTPSGRAFLLVVCGMVLLTIHSGLVQAQASRSERGLAELAELREEALGNRRAPTSDEARRVADALESARFVERYGLLPTPGNAVQLAWYQLLSGRPDEFEAYLEDGARQAPRDADLPYDLGRFHEARQRVPQAIEAYRASLAIEGSATAYDRLARLLWQTGRPEEALAVYGEAVQWSPANPDLHFNRGVAAAGLGRVGEAVEAFRRVLELDPDRREARENLAGLERAADESP